MVLPIGIAAEPLVPLGWLALGQCVFLQRGVTPVGCQFIADGHPEPQVTRQHERHAENVFVHNAVGGDCCDVDCSGSGAGGGVCGGAGWLRLAYGGAGG